MTFPPAMAVSLDRTAGVALSGLVVAIILRDAAGLEGMRLVARIALLGSVLALTVNRAPHRWPFLAVSLVLAAWVTATRPDWRELLGQALDSAAFVGGFFAALGALRHAADLSPAIARAAQYLADRPPGRRYLALLAGGQSFALLLGYGSISLLGALVISSTADEPDATIRRIRRRRMLLAVQHGFVACIAWSPLSFGMILTVQLTPGASWADALPFAAVGSLIFSAVGWGLDTALKPRRRGPASAPPDHGRTTCDIMPLLVLLAVLATSLIAAHEILGLSAAVGVMIVVPLLSAAWLGISGPPGVSRFGHAVKEARVYAVSRLPSFAGEITLLVCASFLGTAGGRALAPLVETVLDLQAVPTPILLVALVWILPLMGYLGAHPLLSVSLLFPILPTPAELGIAPTTLVVAVTAGWALSGATSPFTAATLLIGRFAGVSVTRVGLVWNGPFTLVCLVLASGYVALLARHL